MGWISILYVLYSTIVLVVTVLAVPHVTISLPLSAKCFPVK